jgi:hypothetical protein
VCRSELLLNLPRSTVPQERLNVRFSRRNERQHEEKHQHLAHHDESSNPEGIGQRTIEGRKEEITSPAWAIHAKAFVAASEGYGTSRNTKGRPDDSFRDGLPELDHQDPDEEGREQRQLGGLR